MQLGWMRSANARAQRRSLSDDLDAISQADALGFSQIHLGAAWRGEEHNLPKTKGVRIGLDLGAFAADTPEAIAANIRDVYDRLDGRLVVRLATPTATARQAINALYEALRSESYPSSLGKNFPIHPPQPEVLVMPPAGSAAHVSQAAACGFHVLSPAWQLQRDIAQHWPLIVAGATHATRRACPSHWHVARFVFVSDDPGRIEAYEAGVAETHPQCLPLCLPQALATGSDRAERIIAGPIEHVTSRLQDLRRRIGPFGVLHATDPGLDPGEAAHQRHVLAREVAPALRGTQKRPAKRELERI